MPAVLFTKEEIIRSTFEIYKEIGFEKITARKIAAKMGCSVVPIYSNFKSIKELKSCMMDQTLELLLDYTRHHYCEHLFLNIGLGILAFAKEYRELYRTLFINNNQYAYLMDELFQNNLELMKKDQMLQGFTAKELERILEKTRLFTHGLAVFICSGSMDDQSDEYIADLLKEAGEDMIGYMVYKKIKTKG